MRLSIYILLISFAFGACQEKAQIEPVIPGGDRVVLLEEFTGKGCTNCPKGNREIENLLAIYDSNLVVVSIHAGTFADPMFFPLGQFDLRTEVGNNIFQMLGPNLGYPSGVVDRIKFNGEFQQGSQSWADLVAQEVARDPQVDFVVSHTFDQESRLVEIQLEGITRSELAGEVRISVMITEDGIVDAQDDIEAGGIVEDYVHNHVLRSMATPYDGDVVINEPGVGASFSGEYSALVDSTWVAGNLKLIIFVSNVLGADELRVLQATSLDVIE